MEKADEMRARVVEKAVADGGFRAQLMADPKVALQDALGVSIPDGFRVEVHEDGADVAHLVLPPDSGLSEGELEQAQGAVWVPGVATPEEFNLNPADW